MARLSGEQFDLANMVVLIALGPSPKVNEGDTSFDANEQQSVVSTGQSQTRPQASRSFDVPSVGSAIEARHFNFLHLYSTNRLRSGVQSQHLHNT